MEKIEKEQSEIIEMAEIRGVDLVDEKLPKVAESCRCHHAENSSSLKNFFSRNYTLVLFTIGTIFFLLYAFSLIVVTANKGESIEAKLPHLAELYINLTKSTIPLTSLFPLARLPAGAVQGGA